MTLPISTSAVIATRSGTGWTLTTTDANLDTDLFLKDFVVLFDDVVQPNTHFAKTNTTTVTYSGPSIGSTTVELRRKTPLTPFKVVRYGERFASDDWNREVNRMSRRAAEYEAFGIGSIGDVSGVPLNDAYGASWAADTLYAPTRQAVYNKIEDVITDYEAADTAINANFSNYAPLTSPNLLGTPTAPTPAVTANNTQVQTTAGVRNFLSSTTEAKTLANTSLNATPAVNTNNTAVATTAFAHLASVAKRITTAQRATPFTHATNTWVNVVSVNVTPRSANSTFLVFFSSQYIPGTATSSARVRLRANNTTDFAMMRLFAGGTDMDYQSYTVMGWYTHGSTSSFTIAAEGFAEASQSFELGDNAVLGAVSYPRIAVIEFENTL